MNRQKSFTLIELLVVIVIIGILAGVIMISTSSSIDKANIAKSKVFEESIENNLAANMVSRWKLDEIATTNKTPDQWASNTGTLGDGVTTTTYPTLLSESECVSGKCMRFDGNDYIRLVNYSFGQNDWTISVWIKGNDFTTSYTHLFTSLNQSNFACKIGISSLSTKPYFYNSLTGSIMANTNLQTGKWYFLTFTRDKDAIYVFIDGKKDGSGSATALNSSSEVFSIGNYSSEYTRGLIDDLRIYNAALSSAQIKQNYIAGLNSMISNGNISKEEYNERINTLAYE
ncbi:MAG TPA: prepilin-type N-terminal cleavage/methylation domain-containing protein [Candidatus Pacearchaeota archaeon]|nr:prepilin-type N-terminal cleavage/methylation domain-containing protein [Candidatus Pacearchaeota archaeon]